jgi:hypothetical protein
MSTTPENNKPTHAIWQVTGEGERARWNRVGAAWLHKDTKGANLKFDSFPLSGRIVLREITTDAAATPSEGGAE